jgi:hypothetical protein
MTNALASTLDSLLTVAPYDEVLQILRVSTR